MSPWWRLPLQNLVTHYSPQRKLKRLARIQLCQYFPWLKHSAKSLSPSLCEYLHMIFHIWPIFFPKFLVILFLTYQAPIPVLRTVSSCHIFLSLHSISNILLRCFSHHYSIYLPGLSLNYMSSRKSSSLLEKYKMISQDADTATIALIRSFMNVLINGCLQTVPGKLWLQHLGVMLRDSRKGFMFVRSLQGL